MCTPVRLADFFNRTAPVTLRRDETAVPLVANRREVAGDAGSMPPGRITRTLKRNPKNPRNTPVTSETWELY
ncbi:MAG: hypothetical protein H6822_33340 [Planctomycetaceae bacterium]|nr:hypothetical protein [Planctomycetaceae bacterium]